MKISKKRLLQIIKEEHEDWGMGHDEDSRTHPGEKDYTGHKGDISKTDPGHHDYEGDTAGRAHDAIAAIHDLASAAGVELDVTAGDVGEEEMGVMTLERRRRRRAPRLTERQLRRIIHQERRKLFEDSIDHELDNLKKNIHNDIEHIKDLHHDIDVDRDEEERAKDHRKDESLKRYVRRLLRNS